MIGLATFNFSTRRIIFHQRTNESNHNGLTMRKIRLYTMTFRRPRFSSRQRVNPVNVINFGRCVRAYRAVLFNDRFFASTYRFPAYRSFPSNVSKLCRTSANRMNTARLRLRPRRIRIQRRVRANNQNFRFERVNNIYCLTIRSNLFRYISQALRIFAVNRDRFATFNL